METSNVCFLLPVIVIKHKEEGYKSSLCIWEEIMFIYDTASPVCLFVFPTSWITVANILLEEMTLEGEILERLKSCLLEVESSEISEDISPFWASSVGRFYM